MEKSIRLFVLTGRTAPQCLSAVKSKIPAFFFTPWLFLHKEPGLHDSCKHFHSPTDETKKRLNSPILLVF